MKSKTSRARIGSVGSDRLNFPKSTSLGLMDIGVKKAILYHKKSGLIIDINTNKPIGNILSRISLSE